MAHPGGAPRTVSPTKDEVIALGKEYIDWLKLNPYAVYHTEWYSIEKGILNSEWKALTELPEFLPYYEQSRNILASRHMNCVVKEGIAHRFLSLLMPSLKEHEREEMKAKAEANKALIPPPQAVNFNVNYSNDKVEVLPSPVSDTNITDAQ